MISTIEPAVTIPSAPLPPTPARTQAPPLQVPPSVPSCLNASVPAPPLSPHDETLLFTFLDRSFSLAGLARHSKLSLQALLDWWRQPHIKAAVASLTEVAQSRACLLAADDGARAVMALQSCAILADADFYEQADPATRQRAFESARKAANSILRLAGLPRTGPSGPASPVGPASPSGSPLPLPATAGRGVRGSARTERGASPPSQGATARGPAPKPSGSRRLPPDPSHNPARASNGHTPPRTPAQSAHSNGHPARSLPLTLNGSSHPPTP
jgi:hypothetical protein